MVPSLNRRPPLAISALVGGLDFSQDRRKMPVDIPGRALHTAHQKLTGA
jgi:hypothetical protein